MPRAHSRSPPPSPLFDHQLFDALDVLGTFKLSIEDSQPGVGEWSVRASRNAGLVSRDGLVGSSCLFERASFGIDPQGVPFRDCHLRLPTLELPTLDGAGKVDRPDETAVRILLKGFPFRDERTGLQIIAGSTSKDHDLKSSSLFG